jgi:hypothetical protein
VELRQTHSLFCSTINRKTGVNVIKHFTTVVYCHLTVILSFHNNTVIPQYYSDFTVILSLHSNIVILQ